VKADQNNFAGLGATGRGERGESFKDIETGVRAHLEHLMLYAGSPVENPVAERTRKVREWGILNSWQQGLKRPITFADLAVKWAPGNRGYGRMLQTVAERFDADVCGRPDPRPGLVQEARAKTPGAAETAAAQPPLTGAELAQRAIDQAKASGSAKRSGLGAPPPESPPSFTPYKILNPPPPAAPPPDTGQSAAASAKPAPADAKAPAPITTGATAKTETKVPAAKTGAADKAGTRTVMAGMAATKAKRPLDTAVPPAANQKCRVWTASYGGQKAVIIQSVVDQVVNFTVLDVNEATEAREVEAFISAYAKNGRVAGEYSNQAQALDKAFELCPEG
jgi:hypothetical protein